MDSYRMSEQMLNEQYNLNYTEAYGRHVDAAAAAELEQSWRNLENSEKLLEESRKQLLEARRALANLELQNLMTRFAHAIGALKYDDAFAALWSQKDDVALTIPGYTFAGREAMRTYLTGLRRMQTEKLRELQKDFPDLKNSAENLGVGFADCFCLCAPYLVIAEDGGSAKGVWRLQRIAKETMGKDEKPRAACTYLQWNVDFVMESGRWKIWHLAVSELFAEHYDETILPPGPMELRIPRVGGDSPPGNLAIGDLFGMMGPGPQTPKPPGMPSYPEPYETFDEEFLLQEHRARALDYVGLVPEYMMHLPFVFQPDGPPMMDKKQEPDAAGEEKAHE